MVSLANFYRSKQWVKLVQAIRLNRMNENGEIICEYCGEPITRKYDCIGHHVVHLTEQNVNDSSIALNPDNVQLVHHVCHNKIHDKFGWRERQVFVVYGAPLSGKTSYVRQVREQGDLIVDIDSIWQCISGCEPYVKPERLKSNVFGIRDELLEQIKFRRGKWNTAYVVGGYPLSGERERLIARLGAREIFIDTSREECIERLKRCCDGRSVGEWTKFIDSWFEKFGTAPHL